jgi:molybdopterin-containing oxidoreductase family membrane subunit
MQTIDEKIGQHEPEVMLPEPMIDGEYDNRSITTKIDSIILNNKFTKGWLLALALGAGALGVMALTLVLLVFVGIGLWGVNVPVGWGFDIINFVWWIGIGHAGTLISAILLLMRQRWRTSINRLAETMTLFAVMCAGLFPLFHTGRPWVAYWLFPYPNALGVWPQFRSPLVWDVFAVSTYFTVSALFWYMGLIPDIAGLRDKVKSRVMQMTTGMLAMGWRGSVGHWHRYESAYLLLAGLSTPLVVSVHSIVSFDFAVSILPGWHATIFPPYFVAGAVYAGFAMVLNFVIPIRRWYNLEDFITIKHIDWMAKIMLTTGLIVFYGYVMEAFYAWYSGNIYEWYMMYNRAFGPYMFLYWGLIICNGLVPQFLWHRKIRLNMTLLWIISLIVGVGMWLERFVIVPVSLHRDFMPSSWGMYNPTLFDISMFVGTFGLFITGMVLYFRFVPMIPVAEMKHQLHAEHDEAHSGAGGHH